MKSAFESERLPSNYFVGTFILFLTTGLAIASSTTLPPAFSIFSFAEALNL